MKHYSLRGSVKIRVIYRDTPLRLQVLLLENHKVPIVINCNKKMKFELNKESVLFFPTITLCSLIGRCSVQGKIQKVLCLDSRSDLGNCRWGSTGRILHTLYKRKGKLQQM